MLSFQDLAQYYGFSDIFFIDFETRSRIDLKNVGSLKYSMHYSTEATLLSYALNDDPVLLWDYQFGPEWPEEISRALKDPNILLAAFNASFERDILRNVCGYDLSPDRFLCLQTLAYNFSFSGSLDDVCKQIRIPQDKAKMEAGRRLNTKFRKPRKPSKTNPDEWWTPGNAKEAWDEYRLYCINDTVAEREILRTLLPAMARRGDLKERKEEWSIDQRMSDVGVPIDVRFVDNAIYLAQLETARLTEEISLWTGLDNGNSRDQLYEWIKNNGFPTLPDLRKDTLGEIRDSSEGITRRVIDLRLEGAKAAIKKYPTIRGRVLGDRVHGMLKLAGASRTNRDASPGVNMQNLFRGSLLAGLLDQKGPEVAADLIAAGDFEALPKRFPELSTMEILASSVRSAITAPKNHVICAADLSSVETMGIAFLSDSKTLKQIFYDTKDPYKAFAAELYGIPYEEVSKAQRNSAKAPTLGCGFGMSAVGWDGEGGLKAYARTQLKMEMSNEECHHAVAVYRSTYPEVPRMWEWLDAATLDVVSAPPFTRVLKGYYVTLWRDENFLYILLPSGRPLCYWKPEVTWSPYPRRPEDPRPQGGRWAVSYMGLLRDDGSAGVWGRKRSRPGLWIENVVQAFCRDLFWHGCAIATKSGVEVFMRIHDELLSLFHEIVAEQGLAHLIKCMESRPTWFPQIPLRATGVILRRYKKT